MLIIILKHVLTAYQNLPAAIFPAIGSYFCYLIFVVFWMPVIRFLVIFISLCLVDFCFQHNSSSKIIVIREFSVQILVCWIVQWMFSPPLHALFRASHELKQFFFLGLMACYVILWDPALFNLGTVKIIQQAFLVNYSTSQYRPSIKLQIITAVPLICTEGLLWICMYILP